MQDGCVARVPEKRQFPRRLNMGKRLDGIVGSVKMWPTWVRSRDDSSATVGRIEMGSTRVGRELIGLANDVRVGGVVRATCTAKGTFI